MYCLLLLISGMFSDYAEHQIEKLRAEDHKTRLQAYQNLNILGVFALKNFIDHQDDPELEVSYRIKKLINRWGKPVFQCKIEKCKDFSVSIRHMYSMHSGIVIHSTKSKSYILSAHYHYKNFNPPSIDILYDNKPYPAKIIKKSDDLVLFSIKVGNLPTAKLSHATVSRHIGHFGCHGKGEPRFVFGEYDGVCFDIDVEYGDIGTGLFFLENYKELKCAGIFRSTSDLIKPSEILKFLAVIKW